MADSAAFWLISLILFLPAIGALVLAFLPSDKPDVLRVFTLAVTGAVLLLSIVGFMAPPETWQTKFDIAQANMQHVINIPWIPSFDISYALGVDGISFPLVMLSAFIMFVSMGASWSITKHVKGYCILFLILETGIMGVFLSLDFFLFYVFWEVMLLPMYFLIGVWGGPRKEYAAIKFFIYTLVGGVLMLIAMLMLYFASDVRGLAEGTVGVPTASQQNFGVQWDKLHISKATDQRIGRAVTDPNKGILDVKQHRKSAAIILLRSGAKPTEPLKVAFVATPEAELKAPIAEPPKRDPDPPEETKPELVKALASYDEATNTVTIGYIEGKTTAADVVNAVSATEAIKAGLPSGSDGAGLVAASDSVTIPAYSAGEAVHTFNLLALAAIGQHTSQFDIKYFGKSLQWWAFLLLFIGFIIKVPSVPVHTWLPDAHVEAPTPISMILAGVLLKLGGYGIIRICYPICPSGGYEMAYAVCLLGVISMVYGAFAALAQKDFKRMVAYSSVSHMGYVVLGLGVWSAVAGTGYATSYWDMGIKGAMFQMIGHGVCSPGMFFMVGIIYDRVHHRNLEEFGGLFGKMPFYTAMAMGIFFAGLGLPGLCGFIGEVFVVLSVWKYSMPLAIVSAFVVILTAGYILWAIQRVYLGAEYKGPHGDHLHEATPREKAIGLSLLAFCILFGILPSTVLRYMDATIDNQVKDLTAWTKYVKEPSLPQKPTPGPVQADSASATPAKLSAVTK